MFSSKILVAGVPKWMQGGLMRVFPSSIYQLLFEDDLENVVAKAINDTPDIIILDVSGPLGGGIKMLEKIRSFASDMESVVRARPVPVVAICDPNTKDELDGRAVELGVAETLVKPVNVATLRDMVDRIAQTPGKTSRGAGKIVLIIDCEPRVRKLYESILTSTDSCQVITAEDAIHALEQVEFKSPDLIITEQNLPDMTGIELVKNLRESGKEMPVIFVTATHDDRIAKEAKQLGVVHCITKPFEVDSFKRLVTGTLARIGVSEQPQSTEPLEQP